MLRRSLLVLALAGCVLGAKLPLRRLVHNGHGGRLGAEAGRIMGGQDAAAGQFPYLVSLQSSELNTRSHICGGSIITTTRVLTAARCIMRTSTLYAVAGDVDIATEDGTEQESEVLEQIPHPDYGENNNFFSYDIAVFTLSTPFTLNDYVQTIPLVSAGSIPTADSSAVASGWGSTNYDTPSDILQWVEVTIVDIETCRELMDNLGTWINPVVDTMVCTGPVTGGIGMCTADAGGPLVQEGQLIGVAGWSYSPCAAEGAPSGFARVSAFIDFINDNI